MKIDQYLYQAVHLFKECQSILDKWPLHHLQPRWTFKSDWLHIQNCNEKSSVQYNKFQNLNCVSDILGRNIILVIKSLFWIRVDLLLSIYYQL